MTRRAACENACGRSTGRLGSPQHSPTGGRVPDFRRAAILLFIACVVVPLTPLGAEPLLRLVVMEPEIDGDTSDASRRAEWDRRVALLSDRVTSEVSSRALYDVVDPAAAEAEFAQLRHRAGVFDCDVCALGVARAAQADRVLSLRVFRMSNLVLSLHALVRDGASGEVRYARVLGFRGDNDRAWLKAADYLIRDMAKLPPDRR